MIVVGDGGTYACFTRTRINNFLFPNGFRTGVIVDQLAEGNFDRHRYLLLAGVCPCTKPM
jgi:hypothetical protein